ncbi:4Fe-4S binding protein [Elusimicrobiota bacterium]
MKKIGAMIPQLFASLFKKVATENYPFEKYDKPEHFRGRIIFDPLKCIGCQLCVKDCPSKAIKINKLGDKEFECIIDLARCVFCGQCVYICPKQALKSSKDFELAQLTKKNFKDVFNAKTVSRTKPKEDSEKKSD